MKMNLINPEIYCNRCLIKEHDRIHIIVNKIYLNAYLGSYILSGNIILDENLIFVNHQSVVLELFKRNIEHNTELLFIDLIEVMKNYKYRNLVNKRKYLLYQDERIGKVIEKCKHCKKRFIENVELQILKEQINKNG